MVKFLIRLDDACPTMNKKNWDKIEKILDKFNILPIVAVIPNNKNINLVYSKKDVYFWNKVKKWKKKNWSIGIHGYDHLNISSSSGYLGINTKSEFSNISEVNQKKKIKNSVNFFKKKKLSTNLWIAPFHSFDLNTLKFLCLYIKKPIISDGYSFRPYYYKKVIWVPQQLWKFYSFPFGLWTICLHPNTMNNKEFEILENSLYQYQNKITSLPKSIKNVKKKNIIDFIFEFIFKYLLYAKKNSYFFKKNNKSSFFLNF